MANGLLANPTILSLAGKLLVLPDFRNIVSEINVLDTELLLDFILYVRMHSFRLRGVVAYYL